MIKTTAMQLVELLVLKEDISHVIEFLGKGKNFQFELDGNSTGTPVLNPAKSIYERLQDIRLFLGAADCGEEADDASLPTATDEKDLDTLCTEVDALRKLVTVQRDLYKQVKDANDEAVSFSNLKVPYAELDHLSFLSLRIGKIAPDSIDAVRAALGERAIIVPLGKDHTRILAASSKKGRFALDAELKNAGFVNMEVPKDFKGIPDEVLLSLDQQLTDAGKALESVDEERKNYAITHEQKLRHLLASYSIAMQVTEMESKLESTKLVYRITGWLPQHDGKVVLKHLSDITENRIAIRVYMPYEVPSVASGQEKVPVKLHHGKLVGAFERLVFSYGSPVYGSIDPTPFVALFFTLLFGIMFGDAGQGLVFLLAGILMAHNVVKVKGWNKFAPVFMAIGTSSMVMGLLTGEFFATNQVLLPISRFIKGLCGITDPKMLSEPILDLMPSAERIDTMFIFFGFTILIGFIINSLGLIINIVNQFSLKHPGRAVFSKTGITGVCFFWYIVVMVIRIAFFHHAVAWYDWVVIGITLVLSAFGEVIARIFDHESPVFEDGVGTAVIRGMVEIYEVASTYFSNSLSFLRVGAFAFAHAVLGYIIITTARMANPIGGLIIWLVGNVIVIVLEGMIVSIQVIRLQYYEFFSKFFNETGREFKPFAFQYIHE
jgi:V/A-type H+/Na+-transporting ATPase subunit I